MADGKGFRDPARFNAFTDGVMVVSMTLLILNVELPEAVKSKFLPDSDYARAKSVDWGEMENAQKGFVDRYLAEVR